MGKKAEFSAGDFVVYPTHGVGKIVGVEEQEISGHELELFVIKFETEKMTLRVPIEKAKVAGLRRLNITKKGVPPADADDWRDVPNKFEKHFSPKPPEIPTDS